jgi:hypothetical protein
MFYIDHITPFWNNYHRTLEYHRKPFNDPNEVVRWKSLGYSQDYFSGEMCVIKHHQFDWTDKFFNIFNGANVGLTIYRMTTGVIMPRHIDDFNFYKNLNNLKSTDKIKRSIIFLEDWSSGHFFEIDGKLLPSWKAGDFVVWTADTPHMAANIGLFERYTAQLTFTDV